MNCAGYPYNTPSNPLSVATYIAMMYLPMCEYSIALKKRASVSLRLRLRLKQDVHQQEQRNVVIICMRNGTGNIQYTTGSIFMRGPLNKGILWSI